MLARILSLSLGVVLAPAAFPQTQHPATKSQPADRAVGARAKQASDNGDVQTAERLYREAMRLNYRKADWPAGLGLALEKEGRPDEALTAYRQAMELAPDQAAYAECAIRLLTAQGELAEAETAVRAAMKTWPGETRRGALLIDLLRRQNKWDAARVELTARRDLGGLWSLAEQADASGAIDQALLALRASTTFTTGQDQTTAFFLLGRLAEKRERWDNAVEIYADYDLAAQSPAPGLIGAPPIPTFSRLNDFADRSLKAGRTDVAMKAYERSLSLPSSGWRERSRLIDLLIANQRYAEARRVTLEGLRKSQLAYSTVPLDNIYRIDLAALSKKLADAGQLHEAVAALRDQLQFEPGSAWTTQPAIAELYAVQERWSDAGKAYAQADNGLFGGFRFRQFAQKLAAAGKYEALWDAYRAAFPGHEWAINELNLSAREVVKAAYQGRLIVKGGFNTLLCGLDCKVNSQNPMKIPYGASVNVVDFEPQDLHNPDCGDNAMLAIEYMGRQWLAAGPFLRFELASEFAVVRPLPSERPALAVEIGITGGQAGSSGQSAPGQSPALTELALGLRERAKILSEAPVYTGDPEIRKVASSVFQRLLDTSPRRNGASQPYDLSLLDNPSVNAFSTAAGKVYVDSGMLGYIGKDPGLWAAVLGHEIGHCAGQHQYHAYMRLYELQRLKAYYAWRMSLGDKTATWFYLGTKIGGDILNMKLSRDEESEADRLGLMMMAEAGYHPDFILGLFDRLRSTTGDRSRFVTFFSSDHPRWDTRQQRTLQAMNQAIDVFETRWPNLADSPGGVPPVFMSVDAPRATVDRQAKSVHLTVPYTIRHAQGSSTSIALIFLDHGRAVATDDPGFRTPDGRLEVVRSFDVTMDRVSSSIEASIPASVVAGKNRKLEVKAVLTRNGKVEAETQAITVNFPKL